MIKYFRDWMQRYFSDEAAVVLAIMLVLCFTVIIVFGKMLAPVLIAIAITLLIQGIVSHLEKLHIHKGFALWTVYVLLIVAMVVFLLMVLPLLWRQLAALVNELPRMMGEWQSLLLMLPERYPSLMNEEQVLHLIDSLRGEFGQLGQWVVTSSLSSLPILINILIYLILVPILVFFFIKDKKSLSQWALQYLPRQRGLMVQVWTEMNHQIGNYIRGKVIEILITGVVTYVAFALLGLNYAALLGMLVGLSVVVPYIGAAVVTIPVALIGLFQWGWSDQFFYLMVVYAIIQALDGNVLVPLLFSEAVNLHPVAIICAVLLFGGLWGFWGVFFAIPLATLVKAVLNAWPKGLNDTEKPVS